MNKSEILSALEPLVEVFGKMGIDYYIGGSIASSAFGLPRTTLDIDIIADIKKIHAEHLVKALDHEYYIDQDMIRDAVQNHSSFNIIHNSTCFKIDIFILKNRLFDKLSVKRKREGLLDADNTDKLFFFASPEDIIISKLEWFKIGGAVSERQINDIKGIIKVQGDKLDFDYLKNTASSLKLTDILKKVLNDKN
ncbi:MAG: hypothetical protein WAX69_00850 [Victivallales bacterium]